MQKYKQISTDINGKNYQIGTKSVAICQLSPKYTKKRVFGIGKNKAFSLRFIINCEFVKKTSKNIKLMLQNKKHYDIM